MASVAAGYLSAAEAKRRMEKGLPPLPDPPPAPPPTWRDKFADAAFWLLILSPGILVCSFIGMALYIVFKIAFARQGLTFP